jgi:hypothetical protein
MLAIYEVRVQILTYLDENWTVFFILFAYEYTVKKAFLF